MLKQSAAITMLNLRNLVRRPRASLVVIAGIAGVVGVLVSMLAMTVGLVRLTEDGAREDRAVVLSAGTNTELISYLDRSTVAAMTEAPGIRRATNGEPLVSPEVLINARVVEAGGGAESAVPFRGMTTPLGFEVHPEIELLEGRAFRQGVLEVIVGKGLRDRFRGLALGSQVELRGSLWTVVGVFASGNRLHESELIADASTLNSVVQSNGYQSLTVMLQGRDSFDELAQFLSVDRRLPVEAQREAAFYAESTVQLRTIVSFLAYVVGGIMALGATFGAINTLYSTIANRSVEIATLRAIGFRGSSVVVAVLIETLVLAAAGGLLGGVVAWALFNGYTVSTTNTGRPLVFNMAVSGQLLLVGVIWALVIGAVSGLFPAIRAARLPVASALRAT